jgi:CelD/BcsL family acetyltransferase involved in cellulose biosynthesis
MDGSTVTSILVGEDVRRWLPAMAVLAEGDAGAHPLVQHPAWIEHELRVRKPDQVAVVLAREGDKVIGYGAMVQSPHHLSAQFKGVTVPLLFGNSWCLLGGTFVCLGQHATTIQDSLVAALGRDWRRSILKIEEATEDGSALPAFRQRDTNRWRLHASPGQGQKAWLLDGSLGWDAYLASFTAKRRSALKRQCRKMRENFTDLQLVKVTRPEQVPAYLDLFDSLYRTTWHFAQNGRVWNSKNAVATFTDLARRGMLRSYMFTTGATALAVAHGTVYRGDYLLDDIAYDERHATLSPGTALLFEAIEDMFREEPPRQISFGFGNNQYKEVLARRSVVANTFYAERTVRNAARFVPLALYRRLHAFIKPRMAQPRD